MTDTFSDRVTSRLRQLDESNLRRAARVVETLPGGRCRIDGREVVNFGGNDYLDLAHDARVCAAFRDAAAGQTGAPASPVVAGRSPYHDALERDLAEFEGTESSLLFPTGYAANVGVLTALVESGDAVFCDRDNHASIIDAARACSGSMFVYHRDRLERLTTALTKRRHMFEQAFIVTDGVFSMDGTVAPLSTLCDIAARFDAVMIVDEAHGTGVLGKHGRGAAELLNAESREMLKVGTLSKALGGLGGFVAGDQSTIDWLANTARSHFFSTALPPALCAAMCESLRIAKTEPNRRELLRQRTELAHRTIRELGLRTIGNGPAPIVPVLIGDNDAASQLAASLLEHGSFVPAIRPPTVPNGTARLRLSLTCAHSSESIVAVLTQISRLTDR